MNEYKCINKATEALYKDKNSKFFSYAFPVYTIEETKKIIKQLKATHSKANHHCYAYRMAIDPLQHRAVDDGEPAYTAGKPILNIIDSNQLFNVLIVVVRYFGGTLLGTSGLINAYSKASEMAIAEAIIDTKNIIHVFNISIAYQVWTDFQNASKGLIHKTNKSVYEIERVVLEIEIIKENTTRFEGVLSSLNIDYQIINTY
jgi:uncharacterized YigZ family protein